MLRKQAKNVPNNYFAEDIRIARNKYMEVEYCLHVFGYNSQCWTPFLIIREQSFNTRSKNRSLFERLLENETNTKRSFHKVT